MEPSFKALSRPNFESPEDIAAAFQFQVIKQPKPFSHPGKTAIPPRSKPDNAAEHALGHLAYPVQKPLQSSSKDSLPVKSVSDHSPDWDDVRGVPFPDAIMSREKEKRGSRYEHSPLPRMTQEQIKELRRHMPVYNRLAAQQMVHEAQNPEEANEIITLPDDHVTSHTKEGPVDTNNSNPSGVDSRSEIPEPMDIVQVPESCTSHQERQESPHQGHASGRQSIRRGSVTPLGDLEFGSASPNPFSPPRKTVNALSRPVRASKNKQSATSALRPNSRASNISKRREPAPTPSRLRSARQRLPAPEQVVKPQHGTTTAGHPTVSANMESRQQDFRILRCAWNKFFTHDYRREQQVKAKMDHMETQIEEQFRRIHEYSETLEAQNLHIKLLNTENHDLKHQLDGSQKQINDSADKVLKLDEKCRSYKEQLNKAIAEQQRLYLQSKNSFQKAISELEAEEQRRKNATQEAMNEAETVKANIQKQVTAVISEAQRNAVTLNATISNLNGQLEDRRRELLQEQDHVNCLKAELDQSRQSNALTLESVREQNERILDAVKEERQHAQGVNTSLSEQKQKMDKLLSAFDELDSRSLTRESVSELLLASRDETVKIVVAEMQKMVVAGNVTSPAMERTMENLDCLTQICQGIRTQMEEHQVHAQESHQATLNMLKLSDQRVYEAEHEIEALSADRLQSSANSKVLSGQIANLTENMRDLQQHLQDTHSSTERAVQLEQELIDKTSAMSELREKLRDVKTQLQTRDDTLQLKQTKLQEEVETLQQTLETARQQRESIQAAAEVEMQRVQAAKQETDERLQSSQRARSHLELELQEAKAKLAQLSSSRNFDTDDLRRLDRSTRDEMAIVKELTEKLSGAREIQSRLMIQLEDWAQDSQLHVNLRAVMQRLEVELPDLIELRDKFGELVAGSLGNPEHRDTEGNDPSPSTDPSKSAHIVESQQFRSKRVSIRSPVEESHERTPPSISEEREARRHAPLLRSIIKQTMSQPTGGTSSLAPREADVEPRRLPVLSRAHTLYNRPVLGGVSANLDHQPTTPSTRGTQGQLLVESAVTNSSNQRKHQRALTKEQTSLVSRPEPKRQRTVAASQDQRDSGHIENDRDLGRSMSPSFTPDDDTGVSLARDGQGTAEAPDIRDTDLVNAQPARPSIRSDNGWVGRLRRRSSVLRTYGPLPSQSSSQTMAAISQSEDSAAAAIALLTSSQSSPPSTSTMKTNNSQLQESDGFSKSGGSSTSRNRTTRGSGLNVPLAAIMVTLLLKWAFN